MAVVLILSAFLSVIVSVFMFKSELKSVMAANHLLPEPENLTELYFEDHDNLPKIIKRRENYTFTFTIHNLENRTAVYPYVVYLETIDKKIVLDGGIVSLKNGEYASIREDFGPLKPIRMKITVELVNRKQPISFWMEN